MVDGKDFTLGENTAEYASYARQLEYEEESIIKAGQKYKELSEKTPEALERQAEEQRKIAEEQRKIAEQAEKNLQKENARIQKEAEIEAKLREEATEEERLSQIRENAVVGNQKIIEKVERIKQLEQEIADLKKAGITKGYKDYDDRISELSKLKQKVNEYNSSVEKAKNNYKRLGDVAKKALSPMMGVLKRVNSSMLGFGKSAKKSSGLLSTLGSRFKGLALSRLIFNQISKAFNAMISGIKEGFGNLYKENSRFKSQVDGLRASLLTMKNALAGAFAPIVQVAIPYIQQFIGWLTSAIDSIGQFIAAITGKTTYIKAIKQTAGAFEDAAGSAKDAEKAAEGYLSPLDEINKYSDGKDKGTSSGANGAGGSGQMFEEVPISSGFGDIAERIKEMWASADFTELGAMIGSKIKTALDGIDWNPIKETAAKIGKSIGTSINGFVEVDGLGKSIGKSIGEAFNTGLSLSNGFFDNTHWDSIGKFLGEGLNGIIESVDWKGCGHNLVAKLRAVVITAINFFGSIDFGSISKGLSDFAIGLFDSLSALIAEIEWSKLPMWIINSIADFFSNFNYAGIFGSLGQLIGNAIIAGIDLLAAIGKALADAWDSVVDYFSGYIEDSGGNIIQGLWDGISNALSSVGEWIYKNILEPFVNGFKTAFGIHSPSTVMRELGTYLMQGLFDGISSLVDWVVSIFNKIKDKIVQIWNTVKEKTTSVWNGIKNCVSDLWNGIKNTASRAFNNIKDTITGIWEKLKSATSRIWEGIVGVIKSPINAIIDLMNGCSGQAFL